MKPTIYVALDKNGHITDTRVRHPIEDPHWGGVWSVYVPAGKSEQLEAEVERLKYKADKWDNHVQALIREEIKEENHG